MYEGLRLTELHEEWAWDSEIARRHEAAGRLDKARLFKARRDQEDAEIRARVAHMKVQGPDGSVFMGAPVARGPLVHGTPDALREYRKRTEHALNYFDQPRHWINHARHAVPVESCHLCHPQPTRWTPAGFIHEEHIPCE